MNQFIACLVFADFAHSLSADCSPSEGMRYEQGGIPPRPGPFVRMTSKPLLRSGLDVTVLHVTDAHSFRAGRPGRALLLQVRGGPIGR